MSFNCPHCRTPLPFGTFVCTVCGRPTVPSAEPAFPTRKTSDASKVVVILCLIAATGVIFSLVISLRYSGRRPAADGTPKFDTDPFIRHDGGSKIVVHYNRDRDVTSYDQDDLKFSPSSPKLPPSDFLTFSFGASQAGRYTTPGKITVTLMHDTASKSNWHYPHDADLSVTADGSQIFASKCKVDFKLNDPNGPKCLQNELTKDDPKDATYYEAIFLDMPNGDFQRMARAKNLQIGVDGKTITVPDSALGPMRTFADIITNP